MKKILTLVISAMLYLYVFPRERMTFNDEWLFKLNPPIADNHPMSYPNIRNWLLPTGNQFITTGRQFEIPSQQPLGNEYTQIDYDDSGWRKLNLPHDWGIEGSFNQEYPGETGKLPWWGTAVYRKHFIIPESDKGKQIYLDIDGSMSVTSVWCNGEFAGGWASGYTSFRVDLTPYLKIGEKNVIALHVDNQPESSRWYPGGGVYRNIWLVKTNPIAVSQWGTFITTPQVSKENATIHIQTNIDNIQLSSVPVKIKTEIFAIQKDGRKSRAPLASVMTVPTLLLNQKNRTEQSLTLKNPQLWDTDSPHLYAAVTSVIQGKETIDSYESKFGIRSIAFTNDDGFHLNGKRVELQGVCMHHDLGALGTAIHYRAMKRQLEILKEMGTNAIRTSHNPPAPEMLDLCDQMGFVVINEFGDTWTSAKKKNDYARFFHDWHEQDLRALIQRDRNHPCVIMWSTGNEVAEQGMKSKGIEISNSLRAIVHQEDPTRPATLGCNDGNAGFNGFEKSTDVFGFNYKPHLYTRFRKEHPETPVYGSETASCVSTRGVYAFPVSNDKSKGRIDFQVSSYDLYAPSWAMAPDHEFKGLDTTPASAGEFVWTGFDYLGEPTPYNRDMTVLMNFHNPVEKAKAEKELGDIGKIKVPSRSSYFGIMDLAGFKKDRFYLYQARWRNDFPMAHILPHWNWENRIGEVTPIHVYTSGDSAELFINGKSLGKKTKGKYEYRLRWDDVVYQPGEVKVIAYKNGRKWATDIVRTSGKATRIELDSDNKSMQADGRDLLFVTAKIVDEEQLFVPTASNKIFFEVTGPAEIIATDNGDPTSYESFQNTFVETFNGLGLIILRSIKGKTGSITLKATSEGLGTKIIKLRSTQ